MGTSSKQQHGDNGDRNNDEEVEENKEKMSFLKRFLHSQPETSKPSTPREKRQETNAKTKNTPQGAAGMSSDSHDELSLFSGMTFSSQTSSGDDIPDKSAFDEQEIQESQELKEIFEKLEMTKVVGNEQELKESHPSSQNKEEIKNTPEKEHQQETPATVTSLSVQQGKKKKRSHAKRPGYARDNQNISNLPKSKETEGQHATLDHKTTIQNTAEIPITPEGILSVTVRADEVQSDIQPKDEAGHGSLEEPPDKDVKQFVDEGEEKPQGGGREVGGDETVSKQCIQSLYSIDTPSSSEENLVEVGQEQQGNETRDKTSENILESPELDKEEGCKSNEAEDIADLDSVTSEKDLESTMKSEDIAKKNSSDEDGVVQKESTPSMLEKSSKEKGETFCVVKESISKEESGKEGNRTYNLQLDAEERSSVVEQDMQFRMSNLSDEEKILRGLENELLQNYSNSGNAHLDKQKELEDLTQEEANALANDNYDLAEELSVKIEGMKESLEKTKYKLPAVDAKVQEALQLRSELSLKRLSILRDAQVSLEEVREEQTSSLDAFNEENNTRISKEKQSLNAERLRLDRSRAHLQLDTEHLDKEEMMLEEEIQQRTEEFVQRKELLAKEREKIRAEIEEVERRLEQLRASESQCSKNIETEEFRIKEIIEEFSPQKEPLSKQRKELEDQQNLLDTDQQSLNLAQERFNKLVESWNDRKERSTEFLKGLQATISSNVSSIDVLEKQRGEIEEFLCLKHLSFTQDTTLDKLRSSVKQTNQQIKSLTSKITLSERNIASLRKRVTEIEDQISDRNEAKDIAKKERNFKEAKRLKEESEALKNEGVESQEKLERLLEELNQDTILLQSKEKGFKKMKEELEEIEHDSDLKLVKSAAKVVQGLKHQITRFVDNEFLHTLLTAEISTCQNLINELCSKHSIDPPMIDEPQPQEDDTMSHVIENIDQEDTAPCCDSDVAVDEELNQVTDKEESREDLLNQLDELEGKLEAVVDMEDFDEADRIQQEIIQVKSKLEERS